MSYLTGHMNLDSGAFFSIYRPTAVIRVVGEDTLPFLQGQFTQELRFPAGALCAYGLWLNQKGKVVADSFALRDGESWWLVSFTSPAQLIRERLEAYIIADDVVLEDVTGSWGGAVVAGKESTAWFQSKGIVLPPPGEWASVEGGMIFRGRRGTGEWWEWLSPEGVGGPKKLRDAGLKECDTADLERWRILAGIPEIPKDVGLGDLPNEAGLEEIAVSYSKGCYLGQEVMARLKSMGRVRRQLLGVRGTESPPSCPAALYTGGKKVGELRSAVMGREEKTFVGLAMVSLLGLDMAQPLSLDMNGLPTIEVIRPPS